MKKTIKQAHLFILKLDLSRIMARVESVPKKSLTKAEKEYRHFLLMLWQSKNGRVGKGAIAPNKLADRVWHSHILHTELYARMCVSLYGKFIHHHPNNPSVRRHADIDSETRTLKVDESIPKELRFISLPKQINHNHSDYFDCDSGCDCGN